MKNLPTAEEFWSEIISSEKEFSMLTELRKTGLHKHVFEAMKRFAKMHVTEALKEANESAFITDHKATLYDDRVYKKIDENSILNAYPLTNIK